jgi:hypothetical protein
VHLPTAVGLKRHEFCSFRISTGNTWCVFALMYSGGWGHLIKNLWVFVFEQGGKNYLHPDVNDGVCIFSHVLILDLFSYNSIGEF